MIDEIKVFKEQIIDDKKNMKNLLLKRIDSVSGVSEDIWKHIESEWDKDPSFSPEELEDISKLGSVLCTWCKALHQHHKFAKEAGVT